VDKTNLPWIIPTGVVTLGACMWGEENNLSLIEMIIDLLHI
jgi:hypothetical protein